MMTTTPTGIRKLSLVCLPTPDQSQAIEFYEKLGFEKRTDEPFGDGSRWVEMYLSEGTTGIALAPPPPGQVVTPMQTGITLTTDNIDATHVALRSRGVDVDLLILDDFGLRELSVQAAEDFFELVCQREQHGSWLIASNREPADWYGLFANPVVAEGLDRLVNSSFHLVLEGRSYRPMHRPKSPAAE